MRRLRWFALLSIVALGGCGGDGDAPPRYPVMGTVTIDGQPVSNGEIVFLPADGPAQWAAGTLHPLSSKKVARAINAASGAEAIPCSTTVATS